jgi:hypothetical protein
MSGADGQVTADGQQPDVRFDEEGTTSASASAETLRDTAELERLQVENERLREEYRRARRVEYGRTALGLGLVGLLAVGAAFLFPSAREVLIIIGAIGLFSAVLTRFVTPGQFLPVDVAEGIFDSVDESRSALVTELGLGGSGRYVPLGDGSTVRLFVPQNDAVPLPSAEDLHSTLVVPADGSRRGVAFTPTGRTLFREFDSTLQGELSEAPRSAAQELAEGLTDGLELVESADVEVDTDNQRVSLRLRDVPFGSVDRIDHPVVSFVGVGLATALGAPVTVVDARRDDGRALVSYGWTDRVDADGDESQ